MYNNNITYIERDRERRTRAYMSASSGSLSLSLSDAYVINCAERLIAP